MKRRLFILSMLAAVMILPVSAAAQAELEIDFAEDYTAIWNDAGSGANLDGSFWRPMPAPGWYRVGHHAKLGHGAPTDRTMVVKARRDGILVKPQGYRAIWFDSGSGADRDVSIWRPICPPGFRALGDVANGGYAQPSTDEVRCVRETALKRAELGDLIWNDGGSGADRDFAAYAITERGTGTRGLFCGVGTYAPPAYPTVEAVLWAVER